MFAASAGSRATGSADAGLERPHEVAVIVGSAQRSLEAACLDDALGRELERGLEDLLRAIGLALAGRDLLSSNMTSAREIGRVVGDLVLTAENGEERAVRALRAIELTVVACELGERAQDLRVRRVDARRRVELDERARAIADREIEPREVIVDRGALLRTSSAEGVDERAEVACAPRRSGRPRRGRRRARASRRCRRARDRRPARAAGWRAPARPSCCDAARRPRGAARVASPCRARGSRRR